jgi:hypothetical protein
MDLLRRPTVKALRLVINGHFGPEFQLTYHV